MRNRVVILFLLAVASVLLLIHSRSALRTITKEGSKIFVEVCNASEEPVTVLLEPGATAGEVLSLSGVNVSAVQSEVLAKELKNGDRIEIQDTGEVSIKRMDGFKLFSLGIPLPLNHSTPEELTQIPGIGQELAGRIVKKREEINGFRNFNELLSVKGIGRVKLKLLKKYTAIEREKKYSNGKDQ